jgi:Flp pilus assembly protein TadG
MKLAQTRRRGAIAPLTALLLIPLLAMVAFAVDLGWITHTQNELQAAADAAALAGAAQLPDGFVQYYTPGQTSAQQTTILNNATAAARTYAKNYASSNRAGDVSSLNLQDSDIEFGYTDSSGNYTPLSSYSGFPNTVQVLLRRDSQANGSLGTFFGRVLGVNSVDLEVTASATIYAGTVNSFSTTGPLNSRILPMTYDVNHWNNYLQTGQSPDGTTDTVNGVPALDIYPSIKFSGNFGELSLDQSNDGASTISDWISSGVSKTALQAEVNAGLLPLSSHNSSLAPDWKGNPGLKDSTIQSVGDNVGQVYLMPLYKPVNPGTAANNYADYQAGSGNGTNYDYTIVQFVGVKILAVDSTGNNKSITVAPAAVIDPNALDTAIAPAAPPSGSIAVGLTTTFVGAKLTR